MNNPESTDELRTLADRLYRALPKGPDWDTLGPQGQTDLLMGNIQHYLEGLLSLSREAEIKSVIAQDVATSERLRRLTTP
jgi:hypothetical protein